jgi:acyl carrier protein
MSENTSIEERVKKVIIDQLNVTTDKLTSPEVRFVDDLGADSLDQVELIMALEEEFHNELKGADIPEGDAEGLQTVGAVIEYIKNKTK